MDTHKKFYVTTPIYYVTAQPHLGSLYSTVLADVAARWNRLRGSAVFSLTGTDEHGQKIMQAAQAAGKEPQKFVDSFIDAYKKTWHDYHISYDYFVRTTDKSHTQAVQAWIQRLIDRGDIYKAFYEGWYCTPCETYITQNEPRTAQDAAICGSCGRVTSHISEESYFFKLSAYQDKLLEFYKNKPDFVTPPERLAEVIEFVKSGLKDLSISRTTINWGIPFPGDIHHVTYVWADALNNYITAIGYGNPDRAEEFKFWWPADLQVMGKDIIRFHAVYWPAFLMASELALPKKLLVHGWIKVNAQKMSKSLGNVVDPHLLLKNYGADAVRYYLVRHMAITHDAEFSTGDLEQRINSDLANDLGNLLNRMVTLAHKHNLLQVEVPATWSEKELDLRDSFWSMLNEFQQAMDDCYYHRAYALLFKFINDANAYFHAQEPWKVAASNQDRFAVIISTTAHCLYSAAVLLLPVMPDKMKELLQALGVSVQPTLDLDLIAQLAENPWSRTFMLSKSAPLFTKIELQPEQPKDVKPMTENLITIDDFAKIELLAGTIEQAEEVPGSDKLLKLQVNFGAKGMRQILSGVKQHYAASDLVAKQGIFIFNLAPRKMMGLESQGMMLFGEDENKKLKMATLAAPVANGTLIK